MSEAATQIESASARPAPTSLHLRNLLRVSRPGLIISHLWVFLAPAISGAFVPSWHLWVGLIYVTVPLGLLIYGWNDYFDWDVDQLSPRKNSPGTASFFGPCLNREQLLLLPRYVFAAQLPFVLLWGLGGHPWLVGWLLLMVAGNALYNGPGVRLSRIPIVAELTATGIYMLIAWLGVLIHSPATPWWCWLFICLAILNFQVLGTMVDIDEDAAVGKRTLSVAFGRTTSLGVVIIFQLVRTWLTFQYTGDLAATGVMLVGVVFVAGRFSLSRFRQSSSAYSFFILLDWIWLALVAL